MSACAKRTDLRSTSEPVDARELLIKHHFVDNLRTSIRDRTGYLRSKFGGSRRIRNRLIQKHGESNISLVNVPKQARRFFRSVYLINISSLH